MIERNLLQSARRMACVSFVCAASLLCVASIQSQEPDFSTIDTNDNGVVEPAEIPAKNLAVIARYASLAKLDISTPMQISELERGRARYLRSLDGGGEELQLAGKQQFGRVTTTGVRPFGNMGDNVGAYTTNVRQRAIGTFQKFDANRDGLLTQEELSIAYRSVVQSWMRGDRDGNGVLTFSELAIALTAERERWIGSAAHDRSTWNVDGIEITPEHRSYAARLMSRFDKNKNGRLQGNEIPKEWQTGSILMWADRNEDGEISRTEMHMGAARYMRENESSRFWKSDPNLRHCEELAADMIRRFDLNKDRTLTKMEWNRIGENIARGDLNGNGVIVEAELANWLLKRASSQPGAELSNELPNWFLESDADLDGQVILAEFIAAHSNNRISEFLDYDRDSDGIVTPAECVRPGVAGKTRYASHGPVVLEAEQEVVSEIYIPSAITIVDIDVEVSIVKNGDDDLELRLVSPDGTTAVLYYTSRQKAWGGGRMFDGTLIDDEAPHLPQRLPRPPAHRSFRPQSVGNARMLSLSAFYGKSAQGSWRLSIRNNAQNIGRNAGLLEGWALLVKPLPAGRSDTVGESSVPIPERRARPPAASR